MALGLTELLPEPSPGPSLLEGNAWWGVCAWVTVSVILFILIRILLDLWRRTRLSPRLGAPQPILSDDPDFRIQYPLSPGSVSSIRAAESMPSLRKPRLELAPMEKRHMMRMEASDCAG
jgi:hypothetical protein